MAAIQPWEDLKEHAGTLVALISMMTVLIWGLIKGWWVDNRGRLLAIETKTANEFSEVWEEVNRLKQNQVDLRTDLPKSLDKYLLKEDWREIQHERLDTLKRIEQKIDGFIESCRKGECARGGDRG